MDQNEFGKLIKEIRKKNNLTQKELADKYNVTYQAVSKWENGKNMPDISLIKQISKDFNVSMNDMLDGKYNTKKNSYYKWIIMGVVVILLVILVIIIFNSGSDFEFKTLSSNCDNFNISGSISYNKNKSAIYVTNISYCGEEDNNLYKKIECNLYESNDNMITKVSSYVYDNGNVTLSDFLKSVTFSTDNYSKICREYNENSLYLEIDCTNDKDIVTSYKVPLSLNDNCN